MAYKVINATNQKIWWRDGAWTSGEIDPKAHHTVTTDHNADVTMYGKDGGTDVEWGRVWILNGCTLTVRGNKHWELTPGS